MKPVKIPRRVDEPPHMLLWSADELAPMLLGLVIGVMTGHAMLFFLGGLAITNLYRRFRDSKPDGFILHWIYWAGFMGSKGKSFKNPYARRYFP